MTPEQVRYLRDHLQSEIWDLQQAIACGLIRRTHINLMPEVKESYQWELRQVRAIMSELLRAYSHPHKECDIYFSQISEKGVDNCQ